MRWFVHDGVLDVCESEAPVFAAEKLAELLHAAVEIHAHGPMRKAGARGDFRAGHAFHKTQDERFAIGIRQRADGLENLVSFGLIGASLRDAAVCHPDVDLLVKFDRQGAIGGENRWRDCAQ